MKNRLIKVLIVHSLDEDIERIKNAINNQFLKGVFLVAKSKDSFFEKIKWVRPDIVVSDVKVDDLTGADALIFIKETNPSTLFIIASEESLIEDELISELIDNADGNITMEKIEELPTVIQTIKEEKSTQIEKEIKKNNSIYKSKKMLFKAMTYLDQAIDFEQKAVIKNCLKIASENIH